MLLFYQTHKLHKVSRIYKTVAEMNNRKCLGKINVSAAVSIKY